MTHLTRHVLMGLGVLGGLACPFVYVHTGEGPVFVGEILRNVIGKDRETTQTLELPVHLAAWCDVDGRYHQMQEGDLLELRFAVGEVPGGASVALEASGYYVPILQTVAR